MDKIKAYVESIIYYNQDNHYAVLEVSEGGEALTVVGCFPYISAGEIIEAEGSYTVHPVYGRQFSAERFQVAAPEDADAMERYLAAGAIKGVGPALAARIVKRFKADTFRIMEEEPERLAEIRGISEKAAQEISARVQEKRGMRDAIMFMQEYGIGSQLANRIYEKYGPALYGVLKKNPYQLAEDIDSIGFRLADSIAHKSGVAEDSAFRVKCGLLYALRQAAAQGHTWYPRKQLIPYAAELLQVAPETVEPYLLDLQIETKIHICGKGGAEVYLDSYYRLEQNTAQLLQALNIKGESDASFVGRRIKKLQNKSGLLLDEKQEEAVRAAVDHGVLILTGGPGTGKTTAINTLIRYFEEDGLDIELAAPTGRAAKRMAEATGREARTVHRLLEYTGLPGENSAASARPRFLRDEHKPLEADVVIVDEMSMVDIFLMEALLRALVPGMRLILVGDSNQLPSVGAGNVLRDLIESGAYHTVRLTHIFRQAAQSDIVVNAHRINEGEPVDLTKKSRDFLFIRNRDPEQIFDATRRLLTEKLPAYVDAPVQEIQVLTPTRKGALGVEQLNRRLQACLNPPEAGKPEKKEGEVLLRLGDKVMQIKNDYDLEWTRRNERGIAIEHGSGVFNGDMGRITDIDRGAELVTVCYDEDRFVSYDNKHLQELELAYAVTVHKSQGSEYPAIILPMYYGPHALMNRNLLYTAVTRAKRCVCMVGLPQVFEEMAQNETESRRYTGLCARIREQAAGIAAVSEDADKYSENLLWPQESGEDGCAENGHTESRCTESRCTESGDMEESGEALRAGK